MTTRSDRAHALLEAVPKTLSEQGGITLADRPAPLFQLVVLSILLAKPISGDMAVAAARELIQDGLTTPAKMRASTWQHRVDVLGRAHYRRYDESSATRLDEAAALIIERYHGDLRRLADAADHDRRRAAILLQVWDRSRRIVNISARGAGGVALGRALLRRSVDRRCEEAAAPHDGAGAGPARWYRRHGSVGGGARASRPRRRGRR